MGDSKHKERDAQIIAAAVIEALRVKASEAIDAKHVLAIDAATAIKVIEEKRATDENVSSFSNILYKQVSFGMSIVAVLFGAFLYLTNPTKDNDTALQLQDQRITSQQETIDEITKISQNDTQEVKASVRDLVAQVNASNLAIERLSTIIDERIPKIKNE